MSTVMLVRKSKPPAAVSAYGSGGGRQVCRVVLWSLLELLSLKWKIRESFGTGRGAGALQSGL